MEFIGNFFLFPLDYLGHVGYMDPSLFFFHCSTISIIVNGVKILCSDYSLNFLHATDT